MVCNLYLLQRQPGPKQQFSIENAASLAAKGSRRLALHTWTVSAKPFRLRFRVRPGIGAKRVRRGMRGGGGRYCGPAFRGAQGRHVRGSDGTGGTWSGWTFSIGHPSPMSTPGRVGSRGGVAGAEPPHKGGPNRPDRPELQWSVVSGQRRRLFWRKLEWELRVASFLPEVYESSPYFGMHPPRFRAF